MWENIYEVIKMLEKGPTTVVDRKTASYVRNVYGKNIYNQKCYTGTINVTPDLTVSILFIEDEELCSSFNRKYVNLSISSKERDNLYIMVRKDYQSCTFEEKVITVCGLVAAIVNMILTDRDDVSLMTKFYAGLVYSVLVFDEEHGEEIAEITSRPYAEHSSELVEDFKYKTKEIFKMKKDRDIKAALYSLFDCGYIFTLEDKKAEKKDNEEE